MRRVVIVVLVRCVVVVVFVRCLGYRYFGGVSWLYGCSATFICVKVIKKSKVYYINDKK